MGAPSRHAMGWNMPVRMVVGLWRRVRARWSILRKRLLVGVGVVAVSIAVAVAVARGCGCGCGCGCRYLFGWFCRLIAKTVLVRRVVQARRQHDMQDTAPAQPPSRAGQSVHTTALPPIRANAGTREAQSRRSRFFRFRSWKTAEVKQVADVGMNKDAKRGASVDQEEKEKEEAEPRGSWVRQLCCLGCGCRWGCGCSA